jgi:hypothetical protein
MDRLQLLFGQSFRAPGSFSLQPSGPALLLETPHPIFHPARCLTQQARHFRARQSLRQQQDSMETVILAGFFGTANLVLQSEKD